MSRCFSVVLVDQTAQTVPTSDRAVAGGIAHGPVRCGQIETTVRALGVVVLDKHPKGPAQVASADDQDVVEAFPANRPHPTPRRRPGLSLGIDWMKGRSPGRPEHTGAR